MEMVRGSIYLLQTGLADQGLGDEAAHSMVPFMGQGACQAIEDAVSLTNVLRPLSSPFGVEGLLSALDHHSAIRRPRVERVIRDSRLAGRVNVDFSKYFIMRKLIALAMSRISGERVGRGIGWLHAPQNLQLVKEM